MNNDMNAGNEYWQKIKEITAKTQNKFKERKHKRTQRNLSKNSKDTLGIGVSYRLIVVDVILVAIRMFNKNAAEAMMTINDTIWGSLADILDSAGSWCSGIPIIGNGIDAFLSGLSTISESILTLLNFLPSVLYNVWEILFWVFIVLTLLKAIPDILGKYAVEKKYIAARYEENQRINAMKKELRKVEKPEMDVNTIQQNRTPMLECTTQKYDDMFTGMEVFNDRTGKESSRISKE